MDKYISNSCLCGISYHILQIMALYWVTLLIMTRLALLQNQPIYFFACKLLRVGGCMELEINSAIAGQG